jgi:hypothetical protein
MLLYPVLTALPDIWAPPCERRTFEHKDLEIHVYEYMNMNMNDSFYLDSVILVR